MNALVTAAAWFLLNGIVQISVISAAALAVSLAFPHNAAARKWVLTCGLGCLAACPFSAAVFYYTDLGLQIDPAAWIASPESIKQFAGPGVASESVAADNPAPATPANQQVPFSWEAETSAVQTTDAEPESSTGWILVTLLSLWLTGTLLLLVGTARSYWRLRKIIETSQPVAATCVRELLRELSATLHLRALTFVRSSAKVATPVVVGIARPVVILPSGVVDRLDRDELRAVLLHELAHIRGRDQLVLIVQHVLTALYWPHPLVHVLNRSLARAREEVCDNHVLVAIAPKKYGELLLRLGQLMASPNVRASLLGLLPLTWKLEDRIRGILDARRKSMTEARWTMKVAVATVLLAVTASVTSVAIAQDDTPVATPTATAELSPVQPALRTWRDNTGQYSIEAELVDIADNEVQLRRNDGRVISVPLARLSQADRNYIGQSAQRGSNRNRPPQPPRAAIAVEFTPPPADADRAVYGALGQTATLSFENIGLAEFAAVLQGEFGIVVSVQPSAAEVPVALSADHQNVPLDMALLSVFAETPLAFLVSNGELVVLPRVELETRLFERTYAVADVTANSQDLRNLLAALTVGCSPESWSYIGGMGDAAPLDNPRRIEVRQAFPVHQQIIAFLRACKRMHSTPQPEDSVPQLSRAVESRDPQIRAAACYTLGRLGPAAEPAIPALVAALGDTQSHAGPLVSSTLARIGEAAIPELTKALSSDNRVLAQRAQGILNQIRGGDQQRALGGGGFF